MTAVFETILRMSATACLVIAAVLLIRLLLRRAPKKYSYLLWSAAAFRLICPVSFRSAFSLLRVKELLPTAEKAAETVTEGYFLSVSPEQLEPIVPTDGMVFYEYPLANPAPAAEPSLMTVLAAVWCVGVILMLLYAAVSVLLLHRRMNSAVHLEENVWQSDRLRSPFILGVFRPRIYIPFGLEEQSLAYVLEHERCHLRRLDHLIRPLAFLLLALHWFNPLCWLAFFLMSRDMEMSCDEAVLRGKEGGCKAYSYTLLAFAVNRRLPLPTPLAFGESGTKQRIQNVLRWKKPRLWVSIAAVVLTLVVLVACAANPKTEAGASSPYSWTSSVTVEDVTDGDFALWSREIPYHIAMSEEQIAELVAALNAIPENELTTGRGVPSLMTAYLACGEQEYLLRYGKGITELAFDPDTADQFGKGVMWQTSNEGLAAFMETLLTQEAPGCMLRSGEDYTAAKWFPDGQFDFDYDGVNTLEAAPGGTLIFDTDFTADSLTVGEDYYRKISANATRIEQESYTLAPNTDGDFELTLPLGQEGEKLIYYILYGEGKFVVRVRLSGEETPEVGGTREN